MGCGSSVHRHNGCLDAGRRCCEAMKRQKNKLMMGEANPRRAYLRRQRHKWLDESVAQVASTLGLSIHEVEDLYWVFYDDFTDAQPLSFLKFKASVRGVLSDMHLRRVHRLMAGLASGDLSAPAASFSDFLGFAVNYLTNDRNSLMLLAWDIFDADREGTLMMEDVLRLLAETYGTAGKNKQLIESIKVRASALVGIAKDGNGLAKVDAIRQQDFLKIVSAFPSILGPAFRIQQKLQSEFLGRRFWEKVTKKRELFAREIEAEDKYRQKGDPRGARMAKQRLRRDKAWRKAFTKAQGKPLAATSPAAKNSAPAGGAGGKSPATAAGGGNLQTLNDVGLGSFSILDRAAAGLDTPGNEQEDFDELERERLAEEAAAVREGLLESSSGESSSDEEVDDAVRDQVKGVRKGAIFKVDPRTGEVKLRKAGRERHKQRRKAREESKDPPTSFLSSVRRRMWFADYDRKVDKKLDRALLVGCAYDRLRAWRMAQGKAPDVVGPKGVLGADALHGVTRKGGQWQRTNVTGADELYTKLVSKPAARTTAERLADVSRVDPDDKEQMRKLAGVDPAVSKADGRGGKIARKISLAKEGGISPGPLKAGAALKHPPSDASDGSGQSTKDGGKEGEDSLAAKAAPRKSGIGKLAGLYKASQAAPAPAGSPKRKSRAQDREAARKQRRAARRSGAGAAKQRPRSASDVGLRGSGGRSPAAAAGGRPRSASVAIKRRRSQGAATDTTARPTSAAKSIRRRRSAS